jgi:hypothetical protein
MQNLSQRLRLVKEMVRPAPVTTARADPDDKADAER